MLATSPRPFSYLPNSVKPFSQSFFSVPFLFALHSRRQRGRTLRAPINFLLRSNPKKIGLIVFLLPGSTVCTLRHTGCSAAMGKSWAGNGIHEKGGYSSGITRTCRLIVFEVFYFVATKVEVVSLSCSTSTFDSLARRQSFRSKLAATVELYNISLLFVDFWKPSM